MLLFLISFTQYFALKVNCKRAKNIIEMQQIT
jgi:hypothetical protein